MAYSCGVVYSMQTSLQEISQLVEESVSEILANPSERTKAINLNINPVDGEEARGTILITFAEWIIIFYNSFVMNINAIK